jgi:hypothetical protein
MYVPHPSSELNDLFTRKPYQGVAPEEATILFLGLDANYHPGIASSSIYPKVLEYHADGVTFWQKYGVHHPFLLPGYSGDGSFYHQSFARIGFGPEHVHLISFIELLDVPTVGRSSLVAADLSGAHLKRLNEVIIEGPALYVFIPSGVARLMRGTGLFPWIPRAPIRSLGPLGVWFRKGSKTMYSLLHFSVYGKFAQQKAAEALAIRAILMPV